MTVIQFAKDDPMIFGFIIFMAFMILVAFPYIAVTSKALIDSELEIIKNSNCYDLKEKIANKEFTRTMNDAEHRYEWVCEK